MKTKPNKKFWLSLIIFSLVGQIAWVMENMYLNVFIYERFRASAESISLMVSASAIAATVTTILIGALSDKLGKRKLFICGGYICWGLSIWCFALINMTMSTMDVTAAALQGADQLAMLGMAAATGVSLTIVVDCIMTFFGSAANDAAFNAWVTDSTDETNRGAAEGINSMAPMLAILLVFGGAMFLNPGGPNYWNIIFGVIGAVVLMLGVLGFFIIEEPKVDTKDNTHYFKNLIYGFRPSVIRQNSRLYLTLLAYAVFGISIQVFMPYLILYYTVGLHMDNYVLIFAPAIVLAAAFTFFYGKVYDKKGFAFSILPALGLLMAGYAILYFFRSTAPVFIGTLIMLCGYLSGMAVFGAMLRDNTPKNKAGMFQGQRIIGQVLIPGIVGPYIGAAILKNADTIVNTDGTLSFIPNANIFLGAFIVAVVILLTLIPLMKKK